MLGRFSDIIAAAFAIPDLRIPVVRGARRHGPRPARSMYMPHQGPRECLRRCRQRLVIAQKAVDRLGT